MGILQNSYFDCFKNERKVDKSYVFFSRNMADNQSSIMISMIITYMYSHVFQNVSKKVDLPWKRYLFSKTRLTD